MIATITLNPCLDRTITVHGLKLDEVNRWSISRIYAGGKGIDVSRAIHEMHDRTIAYGFIGGHAGRELEILLDEEGVLFSFTPIKQETRTNVIITDTKTSRQTRIDAPGPRISKRELERFYRKMRRVYPRPDLLVVGGSIPPGVPANIYHDIITEARSYGVRTILDSEGVWLEEGIKASPYLVKPNVHEAEQLLKRELPTEEAVIEAALSLVEMGVDIAVISRGEDGIIAAIKKRIVKAVAPSVKVRSAVGAGDCIIAGLALKLVDEKPLVEACRLAAAMGAAAVMRPGVQIGRKVDIETLLPQVKVWETSTKEWAKKSFSAARAVF
jgi:6-phosphofructokinase 2